MYHIVFNCDDNYVKFTAVLITNIIETTNKDSIESKSFNNVLLREHNPLFQNQFIAKSKEDSIKNNATFTPPPPRITAAR